MTISEPSTLITDYVLAAVTGTLAWRMFVDNRRRRQKSIRSWAAALTSVALASLAGGTYHGFAPVLGGPASTALWKATTLTMGLASFFLTRSAIQAAAPPRLHSALGAVALAKLTVYSAWVMTHDQFVYVIMEYGATLLLVLVLAGTGRLRGEDGHRAFIAAGIVVSIAAALVQQSGMSLHAHFNHNDLMHVIQIVAVWLLFQGGRRLRDIQEA